MKTLSSFAQTPYSIHTVYNIFFEPIIFSILDLEAMNKLCYKTEFIAMLQPYFFYFKGF